MTGVQRHVIVGAKGFVGAALVRQLLTRGHDVIAVELRDSPGRLADVAADLQWVVGDGSSIEVILAAIGRRPTDSIYYGPYYRRAPGGSGLHRELDVMTVAPWRVFDLALGIELRRIVFPSSIAVHGSQPADGAPLDETSRLAPFGIYGAGKVLCEQVAAEINATVGRNVISAVRLPSVYGPGADVASRGVNVAAVSAARGHVGHVEHTADVRVCAGHVDDLAAVLATMMEHEHAAHTVYESGGHDASLGEIADVVRSIEPSAVMTFGSDDRQVLPNNIDAARLRAEFGLGHRALVDGMRSVIEAERAGRDGDT